MLKRKAREFFISKKYADVEAISRFVVEAYSSCPAGVLDACKQVAEEVRVCSAHLLCSLPQLPHIDTC